MNYFMADIYDDYNVNNFYDADRSDIEMIINENETEIISETKNETDDTGFVYLDEETLKNAVQLDIDNYLNEVGEVSLVSRSSNNEDGSTFKKESVAEIPSDDIKNIGVYAKVNNDGYITDISSDVFLKDFSDWVKIDEGVGDRFAHAQSQYYSDGIIDENENYLHKIDKK